MIFPIKTATACQLKWAWSTIYLNSGTTSSCHRVGKHQISLENFENFHNTPEKIDQRNTMLNGEWPKPLPYMSADEGCRYCEKIERSGGQSDRQYHLQIPGLVPKELEQDPTSTVVTPTILEVFLTNTCNLSCTYCSPNNSSQIQFENSKYGEFSRNGLTLPIVDIDRNKNREYVEAFFLWLEKNYLDLRRLHLLGGEPLYQKEFFRCVDFFQTHPNKDLEFNIVTNLMINPSKLETLLAQWKEMLIAKQIKRFDVTVSLDCWGQEQEYARWGLNLDTIESNMNLLISQKWLYLNINSTLSPLTIRKFPNLIDKINLWKKSKKINHHFQTVFAPAHHNPDIFGGKFWKKDLEIALSLMPSETWQEKNSIEYLRGIAKQIEGTDPRSDLILQLHTHLDELDRRRGTDWTELFPYLKNWNDYVV
jgi:sulfatase maturation enzyme AslB (radical SAM superfamily)